VYVSAKMGGHRWDTLDAYYRSAKDMNAGYAVRAFAALGARPALPGEADLDDVEAQIGQRAREDARVLVLPPAPAGPGHEQPRPSPTATAGAVPPDARRRAGIAQRAKLFRSGRAQLVHLPEGFRFDGEEVRIRRRGDAVVLEPMAADWAWLDALAAEGVDEDFRRAADEHEGDAEERPAMDGLFPR
jgi:antitoxin VapB